MRALTLRHPRGFAIAHCGKDIENREWDDRLADLLGLPRLIGEAIAIHGASAPKRGRNQGWRDFIGDLNALRGVLGGTLPDPAAQFLAGRNPVGELLPEAFIVPGVVAVATIAGTTRASRDPWAAPGQLHILLADVVPLPEPVACPGSRGFWDLPDVIEREVRRQVEQVQVGRPALHSNATGADWLGL